MKKRPKNRVFGIAGRMLTSVSKLKRTEVLLHSSFRLFTRFQIWTSSLGVAPVGGPSM